MEDAAVKPPSTQFALPGSVTLAVQTWMKGLKYYGMGGREQRRKGIQNFDLI